METRVDLVACDNHLANELTIHIVAAMATYEAEQISLRTKAAVAVAMKRGIKLGSARPGHWDRREEKVGCSEECPRSGSQGPSRGI